MDSIEEIVNQLAKATDAQINDALAAVSEQAGQVGTEPTEENVAKLEGLRSVRQQLLAEQARRQDLAERMGAARGDFTEAVPAEPDPAKEDGEGEDGDGDGDGDGGQGDGEPGNDPGTAGAPDGTVTAAGGRAKLGSFGRKEAPKPVATPRVTTLTTSTGSTASFNAGVQFTRDTLAEAFAEKMTGLSRTGVQGKQVVSRTQFSYPESRMLSSEAAASANTRKIEAATGLEAITAAGGICGPLPTDYDINVLGVTNRPVRDALTRFGVDRGGIQYRMPMDALAMTTGLGVWTVTDDEGNDDPAAPSPAKTCAVIECPGVEDAVVYSTYLCLQFPNMTARFDREWVDANTRAALVAWARFSENNLLSQLFVGSKLLTAPTAVSATRDVLVNLDKVTAYYRYRHRLDDMVPLRMILPRWVLDLFRADITRSLGSAYDREALGLADSMIRQWFTNRGVNVTFHLDGLAATDQPPVGAGPEDFANQQYPNATAGSPIPGFFDTIEALLFAEGDWLYLDGGTLDLGVVRDSQLNRINRYQTFVENFEGTAFNGIESLRLKMSVQPTGAVAGTIDTSALTY